MTDEGAAAGPLPSLSIVMPTFNRAASLETSVRAALHDDAVQEVIVVVDGSVDGSLERLEAMARDDGRLRPIWVDNGGQFRALATGVERATGEVVLLIDDDVVLRPGTAAGHARRHRGEDGLVVLGYMPTRLSVPRRPGQFATWLYADDYEWQCRIYDVDPDAVLRNLWGGNLSLRRRDALCVGLTRADGRRHYNEDREFGLRCMKAGLRGVFCRQLSADHHHQRSLPAYMADARRRALGDMAVHAEHADVVGPLTLRRYAEGLPWPARLVIGLGPRLPRTFTRRLLALTVRLTGAVHWWKGESLAGIVTMHVIEVQTITDTASG